MLLPPCEYLLSTGHRESLPASCAVKIHPFAAHLTFSKGIPHEGHRVYVFASFQQAFP